MVLPPQGGISFLPDPSSHSSFLSLPIFILLRVCEFLPHSNSF